MKKIGFIGAYDKTDLIIYISKILVVNKAKVLIVDSTTLQKTRYTIPFIEPSKYYITTYENIDIAIGFSTLESIKEYMNVKELDYDFVMIDVDNQEGMENFEIVNCEKIYFVTAFDNYSLKKGLEIIGDSKEKLVMTKILFSARMEPSENDYLNFLSFYYSVKWEKEKIYFPLEIGDNAIIIQNQRSARISFKELSSEYKTGIYQIVLQIAPKISGNSIKKILKNI